MFEDWIVRQNIRRFRKLLKDEQDDDKRRVLKKLLTDELAKLPAEHPRHE